MDSAIGAQPIPGKPETEGGLAALSHKTQIFHNINPEDTTSALIARKPFTVTENFLCLIYKRN